MDQKQHRKIFISAHLAEYVKTSEWLGKKICQHGKAEQGPYVILVDEQHPAASNRCKSLFATLAKNAHQVKSDDNARKKDKAMGSIGKSKLMMIYDCSEMGLKNGGTVIIHHQQQEDASKTIENRVPHIRRLRKARPKVTDRQLG